MLVLAYHTCNNHSFLFLNSLSSFPFPSSLSFPFFPLFLPPLPFSSLPKQVDEAPVGSATSLLTPTSQDNRMMIKRILVKCADISNASRPLKLCREWASRVSEEYFLQTEEEKQKGLPVIFRDFDRETCKLPVTQVSVGNFIKIN